MHDPTAKKALENIKREEEAARRRLLTGEEAAKEEECADALADAKYLIETVERMT
jgi:hypothetical protein